ncbi:hypothetical protein [Micromonospora sp. DT233]|uniref:hypothetical protein n=1 Tax=Micromonospora sp. DT233 TaxID=3393432 RepID=UPI003CFAD4A8
MTATAASRLAIVHRRVSPRVIELAYHAAVPVAVDPDLIHLLRTNFFLDPPDDLPYEAEAELMLSPLVNELSEGLYEVDPGLREVLLHGLTSRFGPDRSRQVAVLLEQYVDRLPPGHWTTELENAQRLSALGVLDPQLADEWLMNAEAVSADGAGPGREWLVAVRRRHEYRPDPQESLRDDIAEAASAVATDAPGGRRAAEELLAGLARLPGAPSGLLERLRDGTAATGQDRTDPPPAQTRRATGAGGPIPELDRYPLALRAPGAPQAPAGTETVDLRMRADHDPATAAIDALRASGLTAAHFRSRVVFLASDGPETLVLYAAVCGFAGRRIDAYADGALLRFSDRGPHQDEFPDAGRPPRYLEWAQAGGPPASGIPTASLDPADASSVTLIRYAARLRFVPPASPRAALEAFVTIVDIRRRRPKNQFNRFPFLSTGREPVPVAKKDPHQGVDLEWVRAAAEAYRQDLRRSGDEAPEIVASRPVGGHLRHIAEANQVDIRRVLARLGSTLDESGRWTCPGPHQHDDELGTLLIRDNRARCRTCWPEALSPVRLAVEARGLSPDEAVRFVTAESTDLEPGTTVTARIERQEPAFFSCTVMNWGAPRTALLTPPPGTGTATRTRWVPGDVVTASVTGFTAPPARLPVLSATAHGLIERVMAVFVAELCSGQVVIMGIARVPGARTKIAVASTSRVRARAAFIGLGANRIQAAQRMLHRTSGQERIEIIDYAGERHQFLRNAMNPVQVSDLRIKGRHAVVALPEYQTSAGIGSGGLNVQLAGQLVGLKVRAVDHGADLQRELDRFIAESPFR